MNQTKKIENYEDYKKALRRVSSYKALIELKNSNPRMYESYRQRLEKEKAR